MEVKAFTSILMEANRKMLDARHRFRV